MPKKNATPPKQPDKFDLFATVRDSVDAKDILYWITVAGSCILIVHEIIDLDIGSLGMFLLGIAVGVLTTLLPRRTKAIEKETSEDEPDQ